jgi:phosphoglycerate dehydrogenase-like enzyme
MTEADSPASQRARAAPGLRSDEGATREGGGSRAPEASGEDRAVVVGATGAIGQAVVRRLTRRGLPVLAVARDKDRLDELAAAHELVTPCPADIAATTPPRPSARR